jgi:membrane fusion protein, copper/silver efflux system
MGDGTERDLPEEHYEAPMPEGDEPPPRGAKVMAVVRWCILAATVALAAFTWLSFARAQIRSTESGTTQARPTYHCPMHPQIVSNETGECPICHMQLEQTDAERSRPASTSSDTGASNDAGPRSTFSGSGTTSPAEGPGSTPPRTVPIQLALDRIQAIGVRTAVAMEKTIEPTLRVTAVVAVTEQGIAEVHVRASGFVEDVSVTQTGVAVRGGQRLAGIYSPELYQAQTELLTARQWVNGDDGTRARDAARLKLALLGMSDDDIRRVVEKGEAIRAVPIYAPRGGVISKKNVVVGSFVAPETPLYEIQDLSRVYVIADVFEPDLRSLRVGTEGRFVSARQPATVVTAKVDLIYATLDVEARTTRVRMQIQNKDPHFAPGEYGTVEFALAKRTAVVVPRDAIVDTGTATYVFVVESEGRFSPRSVSIGGSRGEDVVVDAGIAAGDRVVSGATFLIDSESRLQASARAVPMARAPPETHTPSEGPSCDTDFDRVRFPAKWTDCQKCVQVHHGMGSMEADCISAIPKPWN